MFTVEIAYKKLPAWDWETYHFNTAEEMNDFIASLNNKLPNNAEIYIR